MKVGIQFWSIRKSLEADPFGTLEKTAELGYKYWELCPLFGRTDVPYNWGLWMPPEEGRKLVERLGVTVIGNHLSFENLTDEEYMKNFYEYMEAVKCYSPGLAAAYYEYNNRDDIKRKAEVMNKTGEDCKKHGMVFHYHNHFHEFQKFGDDYVLDLLMEYTDPELVKLEIDTYWAMRGDVDPIDFMYKYKGRIIMLHQKDFPKNCDIPVSLFERQFKRDENLGKHNCPGCADPITFAEVGTGIMDIQKIIDVGNEIGSKYITLEQDQTQLGEMESIRVSMEAFHKYEGIEWD